MLRDQDRIDAIDEGTKPSEMAPIQVVGAAQRETDAVQAYGIVAAELLQRRHRRRAAEIVLRMHLEQAEGGSGAHDFPDMRPAQADAGRGRAILPLRSLSHHRALP